MATFLGTPGNDSLLGIAGNDTYQLGEGADVITYNATVDGLGVLTWNYGFDTVISTDSDVAGANKDEIVFNFSPDYIWGRKVGNDLVLSVYSTVQTGDVDPGTTGEVGRITLVNAFSANINDRIGRISGANGFYFEAIPIPTADEFGNVAIYRSFDPNLDGSYREGYEDINLQSTRETFVQANGNATDTYFDPYSVFGWFLVQKEYVGWGTGSPTLVKTTQFNDDGTYVITGSNGADGLSIPIPASGTLNGLAGNDTLDGSGLNDTLNGGDGNDLLRGNDGNDALNGGNGDDRLIGGFGNETLMDGGSGFDTLAYGDYLPTNTGYVFNYSYQGPNGFSNVQVSGRTVGYFEQDNGVINIEQINGTAQDDIMRDLGNDRETNFNGGRGNDEISGSPFDTFLDFVLYNDITDPNVHLEVDLDWQHEYTLGGFFGNAALFSGASVTPFEVDSLHRIAAVLGTAGNDLMWGTDYQPFEYFRGMAGNDTIDGRGANDIVDYGNAGRAVNITLAASGTDTIVADDGTGGVGFGGVDTLRNIESLYGTNLADTLTGNASDNRLRGRNGNDTIDGGAGFDIADYRNAGVGVSLTLVDVGPSVVVDGQGGTDTLTNIEGFRGGDFNDSLAGNSQANRLEGGSGDDSMVGGLGNDTLDGQAGFDTVRYTNLSDVNGYNFTYNRVANTVAVTGKGTNSAYTETDTVFSIDRIGGTSGNDTLVDAVAGANRWFEGGAGNDAITGNATDVDFAAYSERDNTHRVNANLATGIITVTKTNDVGYLETDTVSGIRGLWGSNGDDSLVGAATDDFIRGNAGNDTIDGVAGNDVADFQQATVGLVISLASAGLDTVVSDGRGGTDTLRNVEGIAGGALNDILTGNELSNWFRGRVGNDTIDGAGGIDVVSHTSAFSSVSVDLQTNGVGIQGTSSDGEGGFDILFNIENAIGGDFNDTIRGSSGSNSLDGGAGDDYFFGRGGNDTLIGGSGFDYADYSSLADPNGYTFTLGATTMAIAGKGANIAFSKTDTVDGVEAYYATSGNDTITDTVAGRQGYLQGRAGNDTITGNIEDTDFAVYWDRGSNQNVTVNLASGVATVVDINNGAYSETDSISGIRGVFGGSGNDSITGDAYDNYFRGSFGNDTLDGAGGFDIASYSNAQGRVDVFMAEAGISFNVSDGSGLDLLTSIEGIDATAYDDYLVGNSSDNFFRGRNGFDRIDGGAGHDTADYSGAESAVSITLAEVGDTIVANDGYGAADLLVNIEGLQGSDHNDFLVGNSLNNSLRGRAGNDTLDGGAGIDSVSYTTAASAVTITLAAAGVDTLINDGDGGVDTVRNVESLIGSNFADTLTGNELGNLARGAMGNDSLTGLAGNDTLEGESGNDTLLGGDGNDTLAGGVGADSMSGGIGDDMIITRFLATGGANVGLEGNDTVDGGADNDTLGLQGGQSDYTYAAINAGLTRITQTANGTTIDVTNVEQVVFDADGRFTATPGDQTTVTLASLLAPAGPTPGPDSITGTSSDDNLSGLGGNDTLVGLAGNDTLDGGAGADSLIGGLGNDTYVVDNAGDTTTELAGEGIDLVNSAISWILATETENLTLTGVGNTNATGNGVVNILIGNAGANVLNGSSGADSMSGGAGNDTYVVDNVGDVITEFSTGNVDTVQSSVSYTLGANLENLTLTGAAGLTATGNALANILTGNSGGNTLIGGSGADTLIGGIGNDTYIVESAGDVVTESLNEGTDLVTSAVTWSLGANIENLKLVGSAALNATGNELANVLTGNSGANAIDGGLGADTMLGGTGDDLYTVDDAGDVITEFSTGNVDTVQSSVSYTLASNVENLTLTGVGNTNATGNGVANILQGNIGANLLSGGPGADTLDGGAGIDTLSGGSGADTFRFTTALNAGTNADLITDFLSATDKIGLGSAIFTGINAGTLTTADFFVLGSTAVDANDRIVYDQTTGALLYDADGNAAGAAVQFATLGTTTHPTLAYTDFLLV